MTWTKQRDADENKSVSLVQIQPETEIIGTFHVWQGGRTVYTAKPPQPLVTTLIELPARLPDAETAFLCDSGGGALALFYASDDAMDWPFNINRPGRIVNHGPRCRALAAGSGLGGLGSVLN